MALSPNNYHGVRSPIVEVHFAGWRSDTLALQRSGWNIAMQQDHMRGAIEMLLHHRELDITAFADPYGCRPHHVEMSNIVRERIPFIVKKLLPHRAGSISTNATMVPLAAYAWVDAAPCHMTMTSYELHTLPLFAELDKPIAEKLIVEPADVSALLDQIKRMQSPRMKEIRANEQYREREAGNVHQFHASIVSLKAA